MKCPNCEHEIEDGKMYCEKCGYEVRIVPDFDPELDNEISKSLASAVSDEISNVTEETAPVENKEHSVFRKFWYLFCLLFVVLVAVFSVVFIHIRNNRKEKSYSYKVELAQNAIEKQEYERAIDYLEAALAIEDWHTDARLLEASCYKHLEDDETALSIYLSLLAFSECKGECYSNIVSIYEKENKYMEICELLANCEDSDITQNYNQYLALEPMFSLSEETYDVAQMLMISTNTNGVIYYTLDGSPPTQEDNVYSGPIILESGEYQVSAIFVNDYGMVSDVTTANYFITAQIPMKPVVIPEGGDYEIPEYIHVEVPNGCTVYYTTDGTDPSNNSLIYSHDISMPLGSTTFKFVIYNSGSVAGDITQVEYHLNLIDPAYSVEDARIITTAGLRDMGFLLNMNGEVANESGTYSYKATNAFVLSGVIYYVMSEYYKDSSGNTYMTQTKYAVDSQNSLFYKTALDENGHFTVLPFQ